VTPVQKKPARAGVIRWAVAGIIIAADLLAMVWLYPLMRSHAVMSVHAAQQMRASVMRECGMGVSIPPADGWYCRMLAFNADGFAAWSGIRADMSILYSSGAFDIGTRTSSLYDAAGDRYSAFYGAYVVKKEGGAFGFDEDGVLRMDEVTAAVEYDYTQLVMANFGCGNSVFHVKDVTVYEGAECAGGGGWTRIDAALRVSGVAHTYKENKLAYLQYGAPIQRVERDFAETDMAGRVYAKHFPEYGCTVMMYCLAPGMAVVDECDAQALQKAVIAVLK
jgi:hypothetical protein